MKIRIHLWVNRHRVVRRQSEKLVACNRAVYKICSYERGWSPIRTLSSGGPQPWVEGLSCVLPGRAGVAAYGLLFCHPWGISIRTRGVLRSWITYFGGLTSPPAPFFGFAGFLIKVVSAELRKQWFLLHGNYCYGSQACRVRVEAFCKKIMKKKKIFLF